MDVVILMWSLHACYSLLSSAFSYSPYSYSSSSSSAASYPYSSSSSASARSLPSSLPISSSLCFNFSFKTAFCLRMLSFSFIMFSRRHFIVSMSSCIFSNSSSNRADFSSAYWISFSRYSTCKLISSSWLCFSSASRGQPRACMACLKREFFKRRLMMLPPLKSCIFFTLALTLFSNSLICNSYSWVSCSTFWLNILSCVYFS